jgi:hypothetical protein
MIIPAARKMAKNPEPESFHAVCRSGQSSHRYYSAETGGSAMIFRELHQTATGKSQGLAEVT